MDSATVNELLGPTAEAEAERLRLVRICVRYTGDPDAAEDLAQEAMIEAWRHINDLRNPDARRSWLAGIAFNVCRRWARRRGRELSRVAGMPASDDDSVSPEENLADDFDVEVELERQELAELLDRAMALLPQATRQVLVAKYIQDKPIADIAGHLGLSEGAIAMRLQRGRLALRRLLSNELSAEAASYGLVRVGETEWQQTRIWCPLCGQGQLCGFLDNERGLFAMTCPACCQNSEDHLWGANSADLFDGVKGFKAAVSRYLNWANTYFRDALPQMSANCTCCGHQVVMRDGIPPEAVFSFHGRRGMHLRCERCHSLTYGSLSGLVRSMPESRRFWQQHPRIRTVYDVPLEYGGRPALLTTLQDYNSSEHIDVISDAETFKVLAISS